MLINTQRYVFLGLLSITYRRTMIICDIYIFDGGFWGLIPIICHCYHNTMVLSMRSRGGRIRNMFTYGVGFRVNMPLYFIKGWGLIIHYPPLLSKSPLGETLELHLMILGGGVLFPYLALLSKGAFNTNHYILLSLKNYIHGSWELPLHYIPSLLSKNHYNTR